MGLNIEKEELAEIVKSSYSIKECLEKMGCPCGHGNYPTFYKYKRLYNLDTSHFTKREIKNTKNNGEYRPVADYKNENPASIKGSIFLKKLVKEGYKEYRCEKCGITEWNGEPISLQLHHKDGNHYNWDVDNLTVLCPNCHSQTDNYCGKATRNINKKKNFCVECGKETSKKTKTGLCAECLSKSQRKVERPSKDELERLLKSVNGNFLKLSRQFGVSDVAVRKWCKSYGLPAKSSDYKLNNDLVAQLD